MATIPDFDTFLCKRKKTSRRRLMLGTKANRVTMQSGVNVETAIAEVNSTAQNSLSIANTAIANAQAAQADLAVHKISPAAHPEAIEAAAGDLLYYSNGKLNALPQGWNTEEVITATGTWTAKVTGWHEITVIAGGFGALFMSAWGQVSSGFGGGRITRLKYLTKGQSVSCIIGAGGVANPEYVSESVSGQGHYGGNSAFGDIVAYSAPSAARPKGAWNGYGNNSILVLGGSLSLYLGLSGGGPGGGALGWGGTADAFDYGGGGGVRWDNDEPNPAAPNGKGVLACGNGAQGCVKVRYFDPAKANGQG